jgi:hypothetical protein
MAQHSEGQKDYLRGSIAASGMSPVLPTALSISMAEVPTRSDMVSHQLFQLRDLRKSSLGFARPNQRVVCANLKDAAGPRLQRKLGDFLIEGRQQFLRHPGGSQQPTALGAVQDFDAITQLPSLRM